MQTEKEFYELLTSPGIEVTNLIFPNDDVAWVSCKYSVENVAVGENVNVAVASYVTIQARLKLYDYLSELGESVMYCDTDSVVFLHKDNEHKKVKTGDYLGDFTNELEEYRSGSFIQELVRWPKKLCVFGFLPLNWKRYKKM